MYFDTHTHGDIMSHYTNDTDTLRQMLAQSIPQMFSSLITIISVFFAMLFTSWQLTIFVLCFVFNRLFTFLEKKMKKTENYALAVEYMENP